MAEKSILIICGEPSGELQAALLVKALKNITPNLNISGVGSTLLAGAGAKIIYDTKDLSVMGLWDVFKKLPKFFALKKFILRKIRNQEFSAVILVDFSGFNLRLAKAINNTVPTIYYVSPQIWASRPGRINTIRQYIQKIIVLFKFEQEFYKKLGIAVDFIGHPLIDVIKPLEKHASEKLTCALLPGSRSQEIRHILPIMLETAKLINQKIPAQFIIAKPKQLNWEIYHSLTKKSNLDLKIIEGDTYGCLNNADLALVCSGTATLEATIIGKPFILIYKMNLLNYLLYRPQIKLPYIGMTNIIAGKKIIPEFIQFQATPKKIAQEILKLLADKTKLQKITTDLAQVKSALGLPGAANRGARLILDFLKDKHHLA